MGTTPDLFGDSRHASPHLGDQRLGLLSPPHDLANLLNGLKNSFDPYRLYSEDRDVDPLQLGKSPPAVRISRDKNQVRFERDNHL